MLSRNIDLKDSLCDHICYRVSTLQEYECTKKELENLGVLLIESIVGGRKISTYKLFNSIYFKKHSINIVELPEPKQNKLYKTGFEHAEFVINEPFEDFVLKYPDFMFDFSGTKKEINSELRLQLSQNTSVKFHHQTLESVIARGNKC